jgi:hypothetical protein
MKPELEALTWSDVVARRMSMLWREDPSERASETTPAASPARVKNTREFAARSSSSQ